MLELNKTLLPLFMVRLTGKVILLGVRLSHASVQDTSATVKLIPLPFGAVGLLQLNEVSNKIKKEHVRTTVFITVPFNKISNKHPGREIIPGNNY